MIVRQVQIPNRKQTLQKVKMPIKKSVIVNNKIMSRDFSWLQGRYENQDVFIVAGGPSLHGFDFKKLENKNVITVNHSYMYVKSDILVALDSKFFSEAKMRGHDLQKDYDFYILTGSAGAQRESKKLYMLYMNEEPTINNPVKMYGRICSTLIAINAALYTKAKNIYLLGVDGKFKNGLGHFFSKEWKHTGDKADHKYAKVIPHFNKYKKFKNIFNLNIDSAIRTFQFKTIDEALSV